MPGGALAAGESTLDAALRESAEEAAVDAASVSPSHAWVNDHGTWAYTTVVGHVAGPLDPYASDAESLEIAWVPVDEVEDLPLLPAFGELWPDVRANLWRRLTIIVDAANVVGSRPDGWWRDRLGATQRLRDRLAGLASIDAAVVGLPASIWWPRRVLVVEGQARGVETTDEVTVVAAQGSGDDRIVATTAALRTERPDDHLVVVSADRELRARVTALGATTLGPGTLLTALDA